MGKKVHKNKDGTVRAVEITGEDAEKLVKAAEEEASKHDKIPCDCSKERAAKGVCMVPHTKQENGKWKCANCGDEKDELEVSLMKGESWYEREEGFEAAIDKALGSFKSMS